jgi:GntR family transcriptional regulator
MGFHEDMTARGFKVKNDILKQEVIKAPKKIANLLNLKENEKVIIINRLRRLNSEPIVLVDTYIPYKMCPDLLDEDMTDKSLYEFLEGKYKFVIDRGRRFIEAVMADEREAKLLNIKKGSSLVLIESISYLKDGRAIEYYHAVHRGDRSRFVVELRRTKSFRGKDKLFPRTFSSGIQIKTEKIK